MNIVADEKVPLLEHYFGTGHHIILKNGRTLSRQDVQQADLLIVRSVTKVGEDLLAGSRVKFVATVASGSDHLDIAWLKKAGIHYFSATGCNTTAVVEYVLTVIAVLQKNHLLMQKKPRAGIIGVGRVGSQVAERLRAFDFEVVLCDPLRAQQEKNFLHVPLTEMADLDLILLHTPLTYDGPFPTFHLIDRDFLQRQQQNCILLNAGRGATVDFNDLWRYGQHLIWCFDVWENEPAVNLPIVERAFIATPHIAGHSIQSKYRAVEMVYAAAVQQGWITTDVLPVDFPRQQIVLSDDTMDWRDVLLTIDDPRAMTAQLKNKLKELGPMGFDLLRNQFTKHEFQFVDIIGPTLPKTDQARLQAAGLNVINAPKN